MLKLSLEIFKKKKIYIHETIKPQFTHRQLKNAILM